ncbi:hypothetical protein GCM10009681_54790 [Luedemannella helvata]|uniref:Integrase n=1 Tax=Luedemannella helvata TaxID=349315 RepID=A0ABP4XBP5_9ACTN
MHRALYAGDRAVPAGQMTHKDLTAIRYRGAAAQVADAIH